MRRREGGVDGADVKRVRFIQVGKGQGEDK